MLIRDREIKECVALIYEKNTSKVKDIFIDATKNFG